MKFLIDSFSPERVANILEYYPVEGVTTNPAIICREKKPLGPTLEQLRSVIGDKMLHVQTMQTQAERMVLEACRLRDHLSRREGDFFIKLPALPEGLKACRMLKQQGIGVTMTAVFSPAQALLCARAGADFVAPYVNKLDDAGDGEACVEQIVRILRTYDLNTRVLAASFRNVLQVTRMALYGSDYITLPPDFYEKLITHPMTVNAIAGFENDWQAVYGDKKPADLI